MNKKNTFVIYQIKWFKKNFKSISAWLFLGLCMLFLSTILLFYLVDILKIHLSISTILTAEIALIIRFFINQKFIFKTSKSFYRRLWQFHLASGSAFLIWWSATNILAYYNVYYIYASLIAVFFSTGLNFCTNFFWIWRNETKLH